MITPYSKKKKSWMRQHRVWLWTLTTAAFIFWIFSLVWYASYR